MGCSALLNLWAFVVCVVGIGEEVRLYGLVERSAAIVVGASEADVEQLLGEPDFKREARRGWGRLILGARPAQWIYGTTIDLQAIVVPGLPFPNPLPVKFRFFSPDDDDLVIEWTPGKQVGKIARPRLDVPHEMTELYQRLFTFIDAVRTIPMELM